MLNVNCLTDIPAYQQLMAQRHVPHLAMLFSGSEGQQRGLRYRLKSQALHLDLSKQRLTAPVFDLLCQLYQQSGGEQWVGALFNGDQVNLSEQKAAWHTRLRAPYDPADEISCQIEAQLKQAEGIVDRIHQGVWRGFSGKRITDIVNLGVGGSDLGPLMVSHALKEYAEPAARKVRVHFASTLDGSQLFDLLDRLNPETTLFLVISKSFTTIDTLSNAATARRWLLGACPNESLLLRCHFIGVSSRADRMLDWGVPITNQLQIWDEVGGRFSLWSCVGLAIGLALGMKTFRQLLAGAHEMDLHFRNTPVAHNIPAMMALIGIWNVNVQQIHAQAILPYDGRLKYFPDYLEQLEMESNGKSVTQLGAPVDYKTCPVIWGEIGANAQHAFYQLLHQGTQAVAADFIVAARRYDRQPDSSHEQALQTQHRLNLSNCLAQSRVLALGNQALDPELFSGHHYPGNQPSSTLLMDQLTPFTLGSLIACYEHKVFVQAVIWGINPFDQWGVELGKQVAHQTGAVLEQAGLADDAQFATDSSTLQLALQLNQWATNDAREEGFAGGKG